MRQRTWVFNRQLGCVVLIQRVKTPIYYTLGSWLLSAFERGVFNWKLDNTNIDYMGGLILEKYRFNEDMEFEEFNDNEVMFYNPADGGIHIFNQTAALILKLLRGCSLLDAKDKEELSIEINFSELDKQVGCVLFGDSDATMGLRIDPNGNAFPCQLFSGEDYVLGNIKNSYLKDILASEKAYNIIDKIRSRKKANADCERCPFSDACMCGCPAISHSQTGDIFAKHDQCGMIKYFMKERLKNFKSTNDMPLARKEQDCI